MVLTNADENFIESAIDRIVEEKLTDFRSEIINHVDKVLHEVVNVREQLDMIEGHKDQLEDHEERLQAVENTLDISYQ